MPPLDAELTQTLIRMLERFVPTDQSALNLLTQALGSDSLTPGGLVLGGSARDRATVIVRDTTRDELWKVLHQANDSADWKQKLEELYVHLFEAEVIEHYLTEVLPAHLREVMPGYVFRGLEATFTEPGVSVGVQVGETAAPDESGLDPTLFEFGYEDEGTAPPVIEASAEVRAPREGRFNTEVEYAVNVRQRVLTGAAAREEASPPIKQAVVLGEPGAGKTFLLGRVALDAVEACRRDRDAFLPVFVPLSKYDTDEPLIDFAARRAGPLGQRLKELRIIWLLDALNEMPREQGQLDRLKAFIRDLVKAGSPFLLSCRVRNYEDELGDVPNLYRIELQDLNPEQIYTILAHYLKGWVDPIWTQVMRGEGLREAWAAWDTEAQSVRQFWAKPTRDWWRLDEHERARARFHADPRQLMLLARNPFVLTRLLVQRMGVGLKGHKPNPDRLPPNFEHSIPNNRAELFRAVTHDMLAEEARKQGWNAAVIAAIESALEHTAAAMQATAQRTEIQLSELPIPEGSDAAALQHSLRQARDAGLVEVSATSVRFFHQLFQEYFATSRLRLMLEDYDRRHPDWLQGDPLPPRDERLADLFPAWWKVGGWRVTLALLGELEGRTGLPRVVRWLAGYTPEIAHNVVLDNNDGVQLSDLPASVQQALIAGARQWTDETDPRGRAAAYRVLGLFDADDRPGVGVIIRDGKELPDIVWSDPIPPGTYPIGDADERSNRPRQHELTFSFRIAKYPITYRQFQAFIDADDGWKNRDWWDGLAAEADHRAERADQWFKYWNHPRETVSWYDAIAFCRWLSFRLGGGYASDSIDTWVVRLPTEIEWEIAARGMDGRLYPYPGEYDPSKDNTGDTGIGQTTAAGIFPDGMSPCGALDMSGNVKQWCLNKYNTPGYSDLRGTEDRAVRGGAWVFDEDYLACATHRSGEEPDFRYYSFFGFRLVTTSLIK